MAKRTTALFHGLGLGVLLLVLVGVFSSCGSKPLAPFVRLVVMGVPQATDKLELTVTINGVTRTQDFTAADSFDLITVSFPPGTTGNVTFSLLAYQSNCLVGSGSGSLTLTDDNVRELQIPLTMPMLACGIPAAKIIVQVTNTGSAQGVVTAVSPLGGINCGQDCEEVYAVGTTITLHAAPNIGNFIGWSGACTDFNDCTITLTNPGNYIVQASFAVQLCRGWCSDTAPAGFTQNLNGIAGSSKTDMVAVGDGGTVLRYDGQSWKAEASSVAEKLFGVAVLRGSSPPTYVAVGDLGRVIYNSGSGWMSAVSQTTRLRAVIGNSRDFYAVGDSGTLLKGSYSNLSLPTSGTEAAPVSVAGKNLNAIALQVGNGNSSEYLMAGDMSASGRYNGLAWDPSAPSPSTILNGVWYSKTRLVAVGGTGATAMIFSRSYQLLTLSWRAWQADTPLDGISALRAVWGSAENNIIAVGDSGSIARWNGVSWSKETPPTVKNLKAIWGADASSIYVVGDSATILRYVP